MARTPEDNARSRGGCAVNGCTAEPTHAVGNFPYCEAHGKDVLWRDVNRARHLGAYPVVRKLEEWKV